MSIDKCRWCAIIDVFAELIGFIDFCCLLETELSCLIMYIVADSAMRAVGSICKAMRLSNKSSLSVCVGSGCIAQ